MIAKLANGQTELTPADHGRRMNLAAFDRASGREGFKYELIDGRIYVSSQPNEPHDYLLEWLCEALFTYSKSRPDVINRVSTHSRVFVPGRPETTCAEPDFAAYQNYPKHTPWRKRQWNDISPILVAEVASDDLDKDFSRNVGLYEEVPSIREYWLVHPGDFDSQLLFRVYRRRGKRWQKPIDHKIGDTYKTGLLPDFKLRINPDA
jgi:Uma2 family endonuclease